MARIAATSGVSPETIFNTWTARDIALVQRVDETVGLPDKQLILLITSALSALAGSDPAAIMQQMYPEAI